MNIHRPVNLRNLVGLLLLLATLSIEGRAQVTFVQVTDPHLFDEGIEASDNRDALTACVKEINDRFNAGAKYQFVVVTGDIGVEKIVEKFVLGQKAAGKEKEKAEQEISREISKGVGVLSAIMASSKVRLWLFVPGNNDLYKEDPSSVEYYHQFIRQLASTLRPQGIEVRDLCPAADNPSASPYAKSAAYVYNGYAFIGFNDASFKNNDDSRNIIPSAAGGGRLSPEELSKVQGEYVEQVKTLLGGEGFSFAYVFYHIPEVDDPYLVSGNEAVDDKLREKLQEREKAVGKATDASAKYSSWFVNRTVRAAWDKLIQDDAGKLMGLFAGHLHDWKRETYENFHWLKSDGYSSASLSRLYICPPLAVKRQDGQPDQARGFMEVSIDQQGRILDEWGRSGAHVFWYNPAAKSFTSDENEKEAGWLGQLALGRTYEATGRLADAETAYSKALESTSPVTRRDASEAIRRVSEKQVFPLNRYFFTPWGFSLTIEGTGLLISVALLLVLSAMWVGGKQGENAQRLTVIITLAASLLLLIYTLRLTATSIAIALILVLFLPALWAWRRRLRMSDSTARLFILAVALAAPLLMTWPPSKLVLTLDGVLLAWVLMCLAGWRSKGAPSVLYLLTLTAGFVGIIFALWLAGHLLFDAGASVSPRKAVALAVVVAMIDIWLLSLILKRQGRNVLVVSPLADTTQDSLGATFPHVLLRRRDDIIASRNQVFIAPDKQVAVVKFGEDGELAELVGSTVPGALGKVASWFVRKASRPQYYLRGSLQPAGTNLMMVLFLESAGSKSKIWTADNFAVADLSLVEMNLAYEVLMYTEVPELWQ